MSNPERQGTTADDSPFEVRSDIEITETERWMQWADRTLLAPLRIAADDWRTVLGCGQMWALETARNGEAVSVTCRAETPSISEAEDEDGSTESARNDAETSEDDEASKDSFLGNF